MQTLTGLTDPQAMLDFYLRLGPKVVVLKMGEQGAYLATPQQRVHIPPRAVQVVDATGAGDAFCGSFLARILAGDTPEQAARYANRGGGAEMHWLWCSRTNTTRGGCHRRPKRGRSKCVNCVLRRRGRACHVAG